MSQIRYHFLYYSWVYFYISPLFSYLSSASQPTDINDLTTADNEQILNRRDSRVITIFHKIAFICLNMSPPNVSHCCKINLLHFVPLLSFIHYYVKLNVLVENIKRFWNIPNTADKIFNDPQDHAVTSWYCAAIHVHLYLITAICPFQSSFIWNRWNLKYI